MAAADALLVAEAVVKTSAAVVALAFVGSFLLLLIASFIQR